MKNLTKLIGIIALIATIVFSVTACNRNKGASQAENEQTPVAASVDPRIVGYWDDTRFMVWSFFDDGTFTYQDQPLNYYAKGTWEMIDDTTLSATWTHENSYWEDDGVETVDALTENEDPSTETYEITFISDSEFEWAEDEGRTVGFYKIEGEPVYRPRILQQ